MKKKYGQLTMERRSTRRYSVKDGVYVAFSSGRLLVGTIDNICKDGLCFRYLDEAEDEKGDNAGEITLFSYNHGFFLDKIKCRVVRDEPTMAGPSFIDINMKAMAVRFGGLDSEVRKGISSFMSRFCIREDEPGLADVNRGEQEVTEYSQYMKYLKVVNI